MPQPAVIPSPAATRTARESKTDLAYGHLKHSLLEGDYPPGSRVVLDQVALELGVSKVPVREAVTRLIGEGWLVNSPHVGPTVPLLSPEEVAETAIIRASLERTAVMHATPRHSPVSFSHLAELLEAMDRSLEGATADFPVLNREFHAAVIAPCPYTQLTDLTSSLMEKTMRYQTVRRVPDYQRKTQAEHHAIFRALLSGDAEGTAALVEQHILSASVALAGALDTDGGAE